MQVCLGAILIAYRVVHGKNMPETKPFKESGDALRAAGHQALIEACNDPLVTREGSFKHPERAIPALRNLHPEVMTQYPNA